MADIIDFESAVTHFYYHSDDDSKDEHIRTIFRFYQTIEAGRLETKGVNNETCSDSSGSRKPKRKRRS
jgi:hypothetical protein